MRTRTHEINTEQLPPREKLTKLLSIPFEQLTQQKDFFMVYMREQSFSINKELRQVMEKTQFEMLAWYENILKEVYGEKSLTIPVILLCLLKGSEVVT